MAQPTVSQHLKEQPYFSWFQCFPQRQCCRCYHKKDDYLRIIKQAGFTNIVLQKEKAIILPDDILKNYLNEKEIATYTSHKNSIVSITVYGEKPI